MSTSGEIGEHCIYRDDGTIHKRPAMCEQARYFAEQAANVMLITTHFCTCLAVLHSEWEKVEVETGLIVEDVFPLAQSQSRGAAGAGQGAVAAHSGGRVQQGGIIGCLRFGGRGRGARCEFFLASK